MTLSDLNLLFLDLQTSGMRPPAGQILEIGWAHMRADGSETNGQQLFALNEDRSISRKIQEITGLTEENLIGQPLAEDWLKDQFPLHLEDPCHATLIHYAQFEKPYFDFHAVDLPPIVCTQVLTSRLLPTLPSRNLRAVAGHFGHPLLGPNRAGPFAQATKQVWLGLRTLLENQGLHTLELVLEWLAEKPKKNPSRRQITYRIESQLRLTLPDRPGIYRMKAKDGSVLYVGKATSLKDRVNSYFRGVKNRDRRKLEMLAQVWDLEVEECASPLEAALTETDEIKRLDPPYNVALKKNRRELVFYDRNFDMYQPIQDDCFCHGPFRPGGWVDMMVALSLSLKTPELANIFYLPIDPAVLKSGWTLFLNKYHLNETTFSSARSLFALALRLYRKLGLPEAASISDEDTDEDQTETEMTPQEMADKFERLFRRTGAALVHARAMNAARDALIEYKHEDRWHRLEFQQGEWKSVCPEKNPTWDIATFDRLSVLLSELSRVEHRILRQR